MTSDLKNTLKLFGRNFIYPKKPSGKLYDRRKWFSYTLIVILFALPFIQVNGEQLVLLNFIERKFVFFWLKFTPQDFYLFGFAMLVGIIAIALFTAIFGRVWCGWACPQTIFLEMIFRRIEYWIEGDASQQMKLDKQPYNANKIFKKVLKHGIWIFISLLISNTFLAYIIGSKALFKIITEPISEHLVGFISIWVFTMVFYFVFSYVKEIVCTAICPYGRLQGVLLDNKSIIVAYDERRGEPRGKISHNDSVAKGDCVDCGLCVHVCPTGIDIRNGTQMECVNCTACIDACNVVMQKTNRPLNLIGFYHSDYIKKGIPFKVGLRAWGYIIVLFVMLSAISLMMYNRKEVDLTLLRASGTLYQERVKGEISNLYNAEITNKSNRDIHFRLASEDEKDSIEIVQGGQHLKKDSSMSITFFLIKKKADIDEFKSPVRISIIENNQKINTVKSTFYAQPN
ncbi:cytochrome c oxidase accessory protein CcoG [Pedobacter flavus]|uniref:Cytochrome c oxidase accessory protein CcoG n=1 Tax=Pedobacter flavus TaxID=3113906 RepID=A0ABU7H393_9SPHI|nr:cytochrome c oxidase accessory protein CcoG [Pedobacter sp. VNH31]MEE1885807.1 cytochrome c oxidase accessory protein CcoG [Pedobacter sp. VNH31]